MGLPTSANLSALEYGMVDPTTERQWLIASPAWPAPMTATSVAYM